MNTVSLSNEIMRCGQLPVNALQNLLARYGLDVMPVAPHAPIPGSFWGDPEAGLIDQQLYVRDDTPVHSAMHEACHFICMDTSRRTKLHTDAGGHYAEENGVCYLQILLADYLPNMDKQTMMQNMDQWGYSFRLGSASAWFHQDATDAVAWLLEHGLINAHQQPTWQLRA